MSMTIGKRIAMGFGIILILVAASSSLSLYFSNVVDKGVSLSDERFEQLSIFSEFKYQFKNTTLAYMDAIIDADSGQVDGDIVQTHKNFTTYVKDNKAKFIAAVDTKEERANLDKILSNVNSFTEAGAGLFKSIITKAGEEEMGKYDDIIDDVADITANLIAANVASIQDEYREASEDLGASNNTNIKMQWISIFSILTLGLFFAIYITRQVTKILNTITENLAEASAQTASASVQLSSAAQELSSGANEQASSIEETSSSLEEMSGMVENNVANAEKAVDLSNRTATASAQGNESMEKLQDSMKEILASNDKIEELVRVIGNIGDKTQVMDEIVFQTKLLSFNASVEAERAGEHGRGFAVVAQEVGNLAHMSGKAAQEIATIVKDSIKDAEVITNENKKKVEQGNGFVVETAKILKEISDSSATVAKGSEQVLDASKDQAGGIKQINTAMTQLDKATQENAATAEETASTSEELNAQTETLDRLVDELTMLVIGHNRDKKDNRGVSAGHVQVKRSDKKQSTVVKMKDYRKNNQSTKEGEYVEDPVATAVNDDSWEKL